MGAGANAFIGRASQLSDLARALERAAQAEGALVVVTGDAGMGKTRLFEEAAGRARAMDFDVVWAACWETGAVAALWPWRQLVRELLDTRPGLRSGIGDRARWLDVVVGRAQAPGGSDPDTARLETADAITSLLREAARERPLLVVIDDLHWADVPSLRLLAAVAPALRTLPVVAGVTWRDTDVAGELAALAPVFLRLGLATTLEGLTPGEVGELIAGTTGAPADMALVDTLHRRARGNPLFTRELLRLGTGATVGLPPTAVATLEARIRRLTAECQGLLAVSAVAGDDFTVEQIAQAAGTTADAVLASLDEAAMARLVEAGARPGRFRFVHSLARAAALEGHGLTRRVRLHASMAAALEQLRDAGQLVEPAALAFQFTAAAAVPGCAAKAVDYSVEAAAEARRRAAYEDAARWLRQALAALDLDPSATDRAALLCDLGDAELASGAAGQARRAYSDAAAAARAGGRPAVFARAALGVGGGEGFEVNLADQEQVDLLEEALGMIGDEDLALRSRLCGRLSIALTYGPSHARRHALAEESVTLARASGDEGALGWALAAYCDAISGPAHIDGRERAASEAVVLAQKCRDRRLELLGRRLRAMAFLERSDVSAFDREVDAYELIARSLRRPLYLWLVPLWRAMRAGMAGRFDDAAVLRAEAADFGRQAGSDNAALLVTVQHWCALLDEGRAADALAVFESLGVEHLESTSVAVSESLTLAAAGRLADARARFDQVAGRLPDLPLDAEWLPALCQVALVVDLLDGHPVAEWAYRVLAPHARQSAVEGIGAWCRGSVEESLGLLARALGRPAEADRHFAAAVAANESAGASVAARRSADRRTKAVAAAVFRRDGETWEISWAGAAVRARDRKGFVDLARLLATPGREIPAIDLAGASLVDGGSGAVLDQAAREAYAARVREIDTELDESDSRGDAGRSARLTAERDALMAQLTAAYGLGGRARTLGGSAAERARSTVTQRIRDALRHLDSVHPELAAHLRASVRTGAFCAYVPSEDVTWGL